MTTRERLERKLEKRRDWAESRDRKEADLLSRNAPFRGDTAFFTQPGRITERERFFSRSERAYEHGKMADHHRTAASGLERALDRSIYSDDHDATDALEARIKENEAKREQMKLINKLYRKNDSVGLEKLGLNLASMQARLNAESVMSWCRIPYPAYELTNLSARINADRKRLTVVKNRQEDASEAKAAPAGVTVKKLPSSEYGVITFAEKPSREIINALKAAGFSWGGGSWGGKLTSLPATCPTANGYDLEQWEAIKEASHA